jgi:choline dehydrogenase-like flavoprotein
MTDSNQTFDVIVVGSGASGGWACKRLAEAGLKVALLEAGRPQSNSNFTAADPDGLRYLHRVQLRLVLQRPR